MFTRNPQNRIKNHTGTVHYADRGAIACGPVKTAACWQRWTIEDVTCAKCIAMFGADESTDLRDPEPPQNEAFARRTAERAARQAARFAQ